jgi:hypothetical protein
MRITHCILLFLHFVVPILSAVQSVSFTESVPLEWLISWVEEANVDQGYTLTVRDSPARKNYIGTIPSGQHSFYLDSASASSLSWNGVVFSGLIASTNYILYVRGLDDGVVKNINAGYPLVLSGPPTDFTVCHHTDETSVPASGLNDAYPGGCQLENLNNTLRVHWERPTVTGYVAPPVVYCTDLKPCWVCVVLILINP